MIYFNSIESFEAATGYIEKFRAKLPAEYNARRKLQKPIPFTSPPRMTHQQEPQQQQQLQQQNQADLNEGTDSTQNIGEQPQNHVDSSNDDNQSLENERQNGNENGRESENEFETEIGDMSPLLYVDNESQQTEIDDHIDDESLMPSSDENTGFQPDLNVTIDGTTVHATEVHPPEPDNTIDSANGVESDAKHVLPTIHVDPADETAISDVFGSDANANVDENNSCTTLSTITLESNETAKIRNGKIIATKAIDGDLTMVYTYGEKPCVMQPLYHIKLNDSISENIPFKENVRICK